MAALTKTEELRNDLPNFTLKEGQEQKKTFFSFNIAFIRDVRKECK